jgi:hypothetical protein
MGRGALQNSASPVAAKQEQIASNAFDEPVFILCGARSGSTLLRFLLDAHPDLACPPETNLPGIAGQLATVWSLIAGAPLSQERGDEPPAIPDEAVLGVRRTLDEVTGSYLLRHGKKRYCDKSLGTARYAELLLRIYPQTKFLCLYRHPMDVIASAIEACPWGLSGYGFDPYIASTPGNSVWALSKFWVDNTSTMLAVEERFPDSCYRLRYEDLVADPELAAEGIFKFLYVTQVPGISTCCFMSKHERFGPADYKIWHTNHINSDSVGRGWSIPFGMIPPQLIQQLNELAMRLDYVSVDEKWGTADMPMDLRSSETHLTYEDLTNTSLFQRNQVEQHLKQALSRVSGEFRRRWAPYTKEAFTVAATPGASRNGLVSQWKVNVSDCEACYIAESTECSNPDDETAWDIVGSYDVWLAVLTGRTNLGVALRSCGLRYCEANDAGPVAADTRLGMLSELFGLNSTQAHPPISGNGSRQIGSQGE